LPPNARARFVRVEGREATAAELAGWTVLTVVGVPDAGFDVEVAPPGRLDLTIADETSGLPPSSARVAAARPAEATPTQRGDITIVSRHFRFE
jgi:hypothetical protein